MPQAPGADPRPWWPSGLWLGPVDLGTAVCAALDDVTSWTVAGPDEPTDGTVPSIVLDALALCDDTETDRLDRLLGASVAGPPPARVITILWSSWLGRGDSARRAGRSALALAMTRHWALRLAPTGTTVNAVAVPVGFPFAAPAPSAPAQVAAGIEDLGHVIRFFGHPDNGYVIGQVVPLCGGDFIWSNHSA
jgi:NAD(P)-dependent dehydrogenase (short-subunit alcohol dehydrogenase family)